MTDTKTFGATLARTRKEQGFSSAHQFFKSAGGSKTLGLSFMSYWDMERGKKLPKSWRLTAIMAALGVERTSPQAKELVQAYFRELSGSDELLQILAAPAEPAQDLTSRELAETAAQRALSTLGVNLTLEQWELCSRDLVTHICQYFLANTAGWVTVRELAEAAKFKPGAVSKALKALAAGGLIEFSGDKARNRFEGKVIRLLPATPATAKVKAALKKNWDAWLAGCTRVADRRWTVRMTEANLELYRRHLEKAVTMCEVYSSDAEDRRGSAIYSVDAGIVRILPKD